MELRRLGNLDMLRSLLGGPDEEHEAIINQVTLETKTRLDGLAGENPLARRYVQDTWNKIMASLADKDIADALELSNVLRIVADVHEIKLKLHKELHDKREAAEKLKQNGGQVGPRPVDKEVQ